MEPGKPTFQAHSAQTHFREKRNMRYSSKNKLNRALGTEPASWQIRNATMLSCPALYTHLAFLSHSPTSQNSCQPLVHKYSENLSLADSVTATDRPRSMNKLLSSAFVASPAALCRLNARQSPGTAVKPCQAKKYIMSVLDNPCHGASKQ